MRILYSHRVQARDGQSVHIEALVAAFRAAGHTVEVHGPGFYERAGFGGESRLVARLRRHLPRAVAELAEFAYGLLGFWRLLLASRRFQPDVIYERYALYHVAGTLLSRLSGLPLFLEVNSPLATERASFDGLFWQRGARLLEVLTWRTATRVLAVTGVLRDMVAAADVPLSRIGVTPNGIDPASYQALPNAAGPGAPAVLGFVGFVREWHGLQHLLDAMAADRTELSLIVVGDGPARPALAAQAERLGLGARVRFDGLARHEDIPGIIAGFDIALQPRAVAYASPLKLFEYMAAGLAIVAPAQPNITEVLDHGRTALLFDPEDPQAMWRAVERLAGDAGLRRRLGDAARAEIARRDYTWAGNVRRIEAWFTADTAARVRALAPAGRGRPA